MEAQSVQGDLVIAVKVKPASGRFALYRSGQDLIAELTSPPVQGKANEELVSEMRRLLRCEVRLLRGSTSRKKLLLLKNIAMNDLELVLDTR
jgi:uncharacterized protein (TIGR00251 family)